MRTDREHLLPPGWMGNIDCPGIHGDVDIFRDDHGIPYIKTGNSLDAWFALGFCQGQDRSFQIEISRRKASGTLSEIFGEETLPADKFARVIGFRRLAEKYLLFLENDEREILNSFTAGINAGMKLGLEKKPVEYSMLGIDFSRIEPADVISYQLLLAFSLSHWVPKITRYKILCESDPAAVSALDPEFAYWNYLTDPVGKKAGKGIDFLHEDISTAMEVLNIRGISNNWIIGPGKSATGHPIMANDPHLTAEVPAPWYLANIECDDFRISGACIAGSPLFLLGYNFHVSWSITAAFIDNIDLYLEDVSADGNFVRRGDKSVHLEKVVEEIRIKGRPSYQLEVFNTDRGPLLSSLNIEQLPPLTFTATWMKPKRIQGFFKVPKAKTVEDLRHCFEAWPLAGLNLICADIQDNTSWFIAGEIPQRKKTHGLLPMPAWDPAFDWEQESLPFSEHPKMDNPTAGFIATANNKPVDERNGIYIGRDFIDGYRHARIVDLIQSSNKKIDLDLCKQFQLDQHSRVWDEIKGVILSHKCVSPGSYNAQQQLKSWQGIVAADSIGATVFEFFIAGFSKLMTHGLAGNLEKWLQFPFFEGVAASNFAMSRISQLVMFIKEKPQEFLDGSIDDYIERSLTQAWDFLEQKFGPLSNKWAWGAVRPLELQHIFSLIGSPENKKTSIEKFNLGPAFYGGDEHCVSVAAGELSNPLTKPNFMPNLRFVVELGNWESNYFSLAGGISGDPATQYYDDLFQLWLKGEGISLRTSSAGHRFLTTLHAKT